MIIMTQYEWLTEQLKTETDECQEWPYFRKPTGYGMVYSNGKTQRVHRLVLQLTTGQDGEGLHAAHKPLICNNASCFNPKHLEWKTCEENIQDKEADGTLAKGESNGKSKLTEEKVRLICALYDSGKFTYKDLSNMMGISLSNIGAVVRKETWSHLWE
jgi:hypothetical protein